MMSLRELPLHILIPAYNEEKSIGQVIRKLKGNFPLAQITVINDGSTDHTSSIAKDAGARVINLPVNMGYGVSLHTGMLWAMRKQAGIVVTMDADGQHEPDDVIKLVEPVANQQVDLVLGSRYLPESSSYPVPPSRRLGSMFFAQVISWLTHQRFTDPTTGFQCMNSKGLSMLANLADFPEKTPDADIILFASLQKLRIIEIPVTMHADESGDSMHGLLKSLFYVPNMLTAILGVYLAGRSFTNRRMQ